MFSIGIHITKTSVRVVELSLEEYQPRIHFVSEYFFKEKDTEEEQILFISSKLEAIKEKYKDQSLRFCYGLSQDLVTCFPVQFPFKEKFKILKTLPFEIENQSLFSPNKVCFDARISKITNNIQSSVLCFISPKGNIKKFLNFKKDISPYLLSCEGSALANLLETWNKPLSEVQNPLKFSVYLYLGEDNSQFLVFKEGHLVHVSVVEWGVVSVVKEMEKFYTLTSKKAWEEFYEKSFILTETKAFTKEQIFFSELIKKKVMTLISKLQLLKMSLESEYQIPINEVLVFGPGSVIKNFTSFLSSEISINFFRLQRLASLPNENLLKTPSFFVAFGLALEGLKSSPYHGLNFLQSLRKEEFSIFPKKWRVLFLSILFYLLIFTGYAFVRKKESFKILSKMESIFIDFAKKITFMRDSNIQISSLKSFLDKQDKHIQNEKFIKQKLALPNPMDRLQLVTQKLGGASKWNLSIQYLQIENRKINIRGQIAKSDLSSFKLELQSLAEEPLKDLPISVQDIPSSMNNIKGDKGTTLRAGISELPSSMNNIKGDKLGDPVKEITEINTKDKLVSEKNKELNLDGVNTGNKNDTAKQEEKESFSFSFTIKEAL